ncbi:YhdH/YhfP family quinone oxidoreductase [Oleiagrimonas sp.]|jgi:acrylyl-CoA reductase (NADPH)|uniref:YhdH/YhfP family quinone oxidoreductase n=1 Tax=Oleiagrimonas sp. TaxID=2010330 RepID=UPI00261B893E|nr:YhdH/YhfP family quinone oxidoreductase [Oleiagrimonas sp.]MDA3912584.1 YhdH/YhfP family quinone oxidoreductase [Oleiagrimonas sp.]
MNQENFRAYRIHNDDNGYHAGMASLGLEQLSEGEVVIRALWSSVNFKDALAGTGKGKILRRFPLNGGIDVAGHVLRSDDPAFKEGDAVLCTGSGLSETRDGGYSEIVRLPAKWTIPLPDGLDLREAMILGTAGFTAGLGLFKMLENRQQPDMGPIAITGATGGVGMLGVDMFTQAGFEVHAISGKTDHFDDLHQLGASQCLDRRHLEFSGKPMESVRFGGAFDCVGGDYLAGLLACTQAYGNVASCGLAASADLPTTVMPFIIRGVNLLGVASAGTARDIREQVWKHLADDWKPAHLDRICTNQVGMKDLGSVFQRMMSGDSYGRTLVQVASDA